MTQHCASLSVSQQQTHLFAEPRPNIKLVERAHTRCEVEPRGVGQGVDLRAPADHVSGADGVRVVKKEGDTVVADLDICLETDHPWNLAGAEEREKSVLGVQVATPPVGNEPGFLGKACATRQAPDLSRPLHGDRQDQVEGQGEEEDEEGWSGAHEV